MGAKDVMGKASGMATRRGVLAGATALGAALFAKLGSPGKAEAANGDPVILGANNAATLPTAIGNPNGIAFFATGATVVGQFELPGAGNAILGRASSATAAATAVFGDSTFGTGVFGNTTSQSATPSPGVFGQGPKLGIWGTTTSTGTALFGQIPTGAAATGSLAAFLDGPVLINGTTTITGSFSATGIKSALVPARGGMVHLYVIEAPESFFEDFGTATTGSNGQVSVSIPEDFREVVHPTPYLVFLTAQGANSGLFVAERDADHFIVRDSAGTAGVSFAWRIVARRKDVDAPRFMPAGENLLNPAGVREVRGGAKKPDATVPGVPGRAPVRQDD